MQIENRVSGTTSWSIDRKYQYEYDDETRRACGRAPRNNSTTTGCKPVGWCTG